MTVAVTRICPLRSSTNETPRMNALDPHGEAQTYACRSFLGTSPIVSCRSRTPNGNISDGVQVGVAQRAHTGRQVRVPRLLRSPATLHDRQQVAMIVTAQGWIVARE